MEVIRMERKFMSRRVVKDGFITLYYLKDNYDQYATWRSNTDNPSNTYCGHYFSNLTDAMADFLRRE